MWVGMYEYFDLVSKYIFDHVALPQQGSMYNVQCTLHVCVLHIHVLYCICTNTCMYIYMYTYTVCEMFVFVRECVLLGTAEGVTSQA